MRLTPRTMMTALAAAALVALLVAPWRSTISAPAILKSRERVDIFTPEFGARIATIGASDGQSVEKGALLVRFVSPDLDYKIAHTRADLDIYEWEMSAKGLDAELLARSQVTQREYESALVEYNGLLAQKARLEITAPIAGKVVDVAEGLAPGEWAPAKTRLASVIDAKTAIAEAYIDEADLERISPGDEASFRADADSRIEAPLRVVELARASTRTLPEAIFASTFGGPITVRTPKPDEFVPDRTLYRVTLASVGEAPAPSRVLRGHVALRGRGAVAHSGPAMGARCKPCLIRESGCSDGDLSQSGSVHRPETSGMQ